MASRATSKKAGAEPAAPAKKETASKAKDGSKVESNQASSNKQQQQPKQQAKPEEKDRRDSKQSNEQQRSRSPSPSRATASQVASVSETNGQNPLTGALDAKRSALSNLWSTSLKDGDKVRDLCGKRWNAWSPGVRSDFLRRAQAAIIAAVQTAVPKKQWAQWEVTVKFCLDDIFQKARSTTDNRFEDKNGLAEVIQMLVDGKETKLNPEEFEKRIDEMLQQMTPDMVPGFKVDPDAHKKTLKSIRSLYACEWAIYIGSKLVSQ